LKWRVVEARFARTSQGMEGESQPLNPHKMRIPMISIVKERREHA
jgi:hypothetical protein